MSSRKRKAKREQQRKEKEQAAQAAVPSPEPPKVESPGGIGGNSFIDPRTSGKDLAIVRKAITGGWNVPDKLKRLVLDEMRMVLLASEEERNKIAAARVLIAADTADLKAEAIDKAGQAAGPVNVQVNVKIPITRVQAIIPATVAIPQGEP